MSKRYTGELSAMASQANSQLHIENVVARILSETQDKTAGKIASWKKPSDDLRRLLRHDYVRSLRKNLPYQELKALLPASAICCRALIAKWWGCIRPMGWPNGRRCWMCTLTRPRTRARKGLRSGAFM
jgi:hypothetical protein